MEAHDALAQALRRHCKLVDDMLDALNGGVDIEALLIDNELMHVFVSTDQQESAMDLGDVERQTLAKAILTDMRRMLMQALLDPYYDDFAALSAAMQDHMAELVCCAPATTAMHISRVREVESWLHSRPGVLNAMLEETSRSNLDPFSLLEALNDWMNDLSHAEQDDIMHRFHDDPAGTLREALQRAELSRELDDLNPFEP